MIRCVLLMLLALVALPHPAWGEATASYAIQVETSEELEKATKKPKSDLVISEITFKQMMPISALTGFDGVFLIWMRMFVHNSEHWPLNARVDAVVLVFLFIGNYWHSYCQ